ncbi:MAG: hypothetical protein E7177_07705 [Erysipelotrichaceae bacterium]|nr:hypothetical protein [Erysipelotrichaceae bacterium]
MKIGLKLIITLFSLVSLVGCGNNGSSSEQISSNNNSIPSTTDYEVIDKSVSNVKTKEGGYVLPFNTVVTLRTFCGKDYNDIFPTFNKEMQRLHILFDRYNDFVDENGKDINNLKVINESYGSGSKIVVDQDLIDLLNLSIELSELTQGYFNPTLGELIDTWNYRYEDGKKYVRYSPYCFEDVDPKIEDIESSKQKMIPYDELTSYLIINDEENTVEFKKYKEIDKVTLSLGAIAKGYAVEKLKKYVESFNVPSMIDGGSSSSYGLNKNPNPNRDYWLVGVAAPYKVALSPQAIVNIKLDNTYTLSVSGDYESSYKTSEGIIRHHILNPYSGYPENFYRVVSLKSESRSEILDGLSTAIFSIEDKDTIKEIVSNIEEHYDIEIALMLEKEVDKENKKIDLYLTEDYEKLITKYNTKYFNEKHYL